MEVEHVDFISVPVTDMERAKRFYAEIDPTKIGGTFTAGHGAPIALRVADVAATRAELEGRGVEFADETHDSGVCHMAPFADPDGNRFMLHRRYAQSA